ncbi:hypothetical protein PTUN_a2450 [Pseudoalteromonas tunicata]|nr:hypothetical protein PTUN_a2450 [Pseudoalteromonas tunicata]
MKKRPSFARLRKQACTYANIKTYADANKLPLKSNLKK